MENYLKAEISASAVRANLAVLRRLLAQGEKLCAVVKADCYGHGVETLLGVLSGGADCLGVATPNEAIHLRRLGYERPILMFFSACAYVDGPELCSALDELISQRVTLTVVSEAEVAAVGQSAARVGAVAEVHVKVDSGMGRSGVRPEGVGGLVERIRRQGGVKLTGMYTHLATADEADKAYAMEQLGQFHEAARSVGGRAGLTLHAANSAAAIDLPASRLDMIRPGIAVYGYQPSEEMHSRLPLRPVMRLTGRLMQIKDVPAGSRCGYGLTYEFTRPSRIGLVPMGYGDGYFRCLSGRTTMRVCGKDAPVRGRVSMDQIVIDLSGVPEAKIGQEVEIISPDPQAPHSVENLARLAGTIPYEITVRLGRRVRRVLVD